MICSVENQIAPFFIALESLNDFVDDIYLEFFRRDDLHLRVCFIIVLYIAPLSACAIAFLAFDRKHAALVVRIA